MFTTQMWTGREAKQVNLTYWPTLAQQGRGSAAQSVTRLLKIAPPRHPLERQTRWELRKHKFPSTEWCASLLQGMRRGNATLFLETVSTTAWSAVLWLESEPAIRYRRLPCFFLPLYAVTSFYQRTLFNLSVVSRCGLAVRRLAGKQEDLGSIRFGSPFSSLYGHCLVTLPTQLMKH